MSKQQHVEEHHGKDGHDRADPDLGDRIVDVRHVFGPWRRSGRSGGRSP
jgi:hypothetical protein